MTIHKFNTNFKMILQIDQSYYNSCYMYYKQKKMKTAYEALSSSITVGKSAAISTDAIRTLIFRICID